MTPNPHGSHRSWGALGALLLIAVSAVAGPQPPAQPPTGGSAVDPTVTLSLTRGQRQQIRLAFPAQKDVGLSSGAGREAAAALDRALRQDLEWSGVFVIQGPAQFNLA